MRLWTLLFLPLGLLIAFLLMYTQSRRANGTVPWTTGAPEQPEWQRWIWLMGVGALTLLVGLGFVLDQGWPILLALAAFVAGLIVQAVANRRRVPRGVVRDNQAGARYVELSGCHPAFVDALTAMYASA